MTEEAMTSDEPSVAAYINADGAVNALLGHLYDLADALEPHREAPAGTVTEAQGRRDREAALAAAVECEAARTLRFHEGRDDD